MPVGCPLEREPALEVLVADVLFDKDDPSSRLGNFAPALDGKRGDDLTVKDCKFLDLALARWDALVLEERIEPHRA